MFFLSNYLDFMAIIFTKYNKVLSIATIYVHKTMVVSIGPFRLNFNIQ